MSSLATDPRRPATLYAGTPRGVAVSRDRGAHWQRILREPRGIETVAVDPHRPGTIWAGGKRVWRSRDVGRTWKPLDRTGPGAFSTVTGLEADPRNPCRLVACTQGGGLLEIRISPGS